MAATVQTGFIVRITSRELLLILLTVGFGVSGNVGCGQDTSPKSPSSETEQSASDHPHTAAGKHTRTNALAKESSPYLLQHAHNPVQWYPWGDEAIQKAKRENKLIFLSVGYAACHWCHVMERESFEDDEIAAAMNDKFVCIKVDREERPDVDQIYMTAVQLISGQGGWPMSVFLTPDTRPFWGGTYFPARTGDRGASTGFLDIMNQMDRVWQANPSQVKNQASRITEAIQLNTNPPSESADPVAIDPSLVQRVASAMTNQFDPEYGGFGYSSARPNMPKFPEPSNLIFLRDRMLRKSVEPAQRETAKAQLRRSLDGMVSGAMLDHIGSGFHRYSVDRTWQIPHFEKMLYDNGQLASVYANAAVDFADEDVAKEYRGVAIGICDFVLSELKADGGAFYAALDADSEGEEGKFYRWTKDEIAGLKTSVDGLELLSSVMRFDQQPNFEQEFYAADPRMTLTQAAKQRGMTFADLTAKLSDARKQLFDIRAKRQRPITDIKVLTAWNGLMIAGMADSGRLLQEPRLVSAAEKAAAFVKQELMQDDYRLKRTYAAGEAKLNGYVDDYAFYVSGLIALHRATKDDAWLQLAQKLSDKQIELFWDEADGGFFFTSKDHASLIARLKDPVDGAIPSAASVSAENLMYLSEQFPEAGYGDRLERSLKSMLPMFRRAPAAIPRFAAVLAQHVDAKQ